VTPDLPDLTISGSGALESDAALPPAIKQYLDDMEHVTMPEPDKIAPTDRRAHRVRPGATRGRPRKPRVAPTPPTAETPVTEAPGIVQAPELVKSEVDQVTEGLATTYGTIGTMIMFLNEYDGFIIINNSENMARSVVAACHPYPAAWRVLKLVAQGNTWTVLALAHIGPAVAIMANHGMVNKSVTTAFRQAPIPEKSEDGGSQPFAQGPYSYPGTALDQEQMTAQQQQELAAYIAAMAVQQGQMTAQQEAAMYASPPVDYGNAGDNGAVGMDSAGGLGDQSTASVRAAFTAAQIDRIREESLRKTQEQMQNGQSYGL
jgi:hypothetical protein